MTNIVNIQGTEAGSVTEALPKGFTYFVRDGDVIKIGSSMRPEERIAGLQTGNGRLLEVMAIVPMEIADEFATHQRFAHLRVRGEWFRAEADLLRFISGILKRPAVNAAAVRHRKPKPSDMAQQLTSCRRKHGFDTVVGRHCTGLLEAIPVYQAATDAAQKANLAQSIARFKAGLSAALKAA